MVIGFSILIDSFLVIITIPSVCLICAWVYVEEILHFHDMTYMGTPYYKNACPGGHEIYN